MEENFDNFINNLMEEFKRQNALDVIKSPKNKIKWPDGFGVYTLWENDVVRKNLIYVGIAGKLKRNLFNDQNKVSFNNSTFKERKSRYTPYRFCETNKEHDEFKFTFRFGPKYTNGIEQNKNKYERDAYKSYVLYKNLIIVLFDLSCFTKENKYTPTLIESLILTKYWIETKTLPPANNEL
jgi:hypothetical protein